jgi:hypothetical protein
MKPAIFFAETLLPLSGGTMANVDSVPFVLRKGCIGLTMLMADRGEGVHGTWSAQMECHGRTAAGSVSGHLE